VTQKTRRNFRAARSTELGGGSSRSSPSSPASSSAATAPYPRFPKSDCRPALPFWVLVNGMSHGFLSMG